MKRILSFLRPVCAAAFLSLSLHGVAQGPAARLAAPLSDGNRVLLAGSKNPRALAAEDAGAVSPDQAMNGITIVFNRSVAQQSALEALLAAQQNPASPQYHQWLTPAQFAAQFGVADSDLATVENWLQNQGFTVGSIARGRNSISFSGTAAQVNAAFNTSLHHYKQGTTTHTAPSTELSLPAALVPLVSSVEHLSDFRPKPQVRYPSAKPQYTSSLSGSHFLDPLDVATQYSVKPLYNSGYNGAGQSIAVVGQSWVNLTDITNFRAALGLSNSSAPTLVLVPGSGVAALSYGDEGESDIDLEYSSGMAPGASVYLVYVGDNPSYSAFDSLTYAVQEDLSPIISVSYGDCELDYTPATLNSFVQTGQQANAQGQTIMVAAGDSGSTTCFGDTDLNTAQQETPSVDVPGDLATVTGVGGLQMSAAATAVGNTQYFAAATSGDNYGSLISYVPEQVWNEDVLLDEISSGGGGISTLVPRPSWQAGVPGIPAGSTRLVPDVALQAAIESPGYLYCSSDPTSFQSTQVASCNNGLRDASTGDLTVAGGTSFSAPIFAGMLAVLNQATHAVAQGNINPTLYSIASNPTTYASAFNDITSGGNQCLAGASFCSAAGAAVYAAGTGYDEASGLGSVNLASLVAAWPATAASSLTATSTVVTLTSTTPAAGSSEQATITVTPTPSSATPATGTVNVLLDGALIGQGLALTNGVATVTFTVSATNGSHVVTAAYTADAAHAASEGSASFTVGPIEASGSFTLAATGVTVPLNGTGNSTVTVTPASGYTGLVNFSLSGATGTLSLCYTLNSVSEYKGAPASTTLSLSEGTACGTTAVRIGTGNAQVRPTALGRSPAAPWKQWPAPVAAAGLLLGGLFFRRRTGRVPALLMLALLMTVGLGLSGCGGSNGSSSVIGTNTTAPQTYTVTLTGTDSVNTSIANSTTFTLTVN